MVAKNDIGENLVMKTIGIFADNVTMPTGMAVVCKNLALGLSNYPVRVIYFGRFGQQRGVGKEPVLHENAVNYDLVPTEGGVWRPRTVIEAVEKYDVDYIFTEDDFFSAGGLVRAAKKTKKPLHFLTPIDSLPIHSMAHQIFKECKKVYVPNSSYKLIKNGVYLPHGVDFSTFYPQKLYRDPDIFTFVWVGRDEPRKAMGRFIFALQKIYKQVDCQAIIHSDWRANLAKRTARYLRYKRDLPVIMTQMEAGPQEQLRRIYNTGDVFVCTTKAGGFEMGITEAMACGKPAVITDWTFMNESGNIENYENGFKIPVADTCGDTAILYNGKRWGVPLGRKWGNISINALADAMKYCVENPDIVKQMGEIALDDVQKYDWRWVAEKLYKEIMGNGQ